MQQAGIIHWIRKHAALQLSEGLQVMIGTVPDGPAAAVPILFCLHTLPLHLFSLVFPHHSLK